MSPFRELLEAELPVAWSMERQAGELLADLARSARDTHVAHTFAMAEVGCRRRRDHLGRAFAALGLPPREGVSPGIAGMVGERRGPQPRLREPWVAVRALRYAATVYEELLDLADKAGLPEVAGPLAEALAESEAAVAAALDCATEVEEAVQAEARP